MDNFSYSATLNYLYEHLPMFQRIGPKAYKADLNNTIELCAALGNPQEKFKSVHVAGTNGKGSSSHLIAAILQSAGYKTGLYTSPHLKEFTERIRIDGVEITQQFVIDFVRQTQEILERIQPSFFETTVAMAFDYFQKEKVDIAVIEVGLGGRLDSTNIIHPLVSLITNIGLDHTDLLGDTLQKIAIEKAGIIKPNVPAIISEKQDEVSNVFRNKATTEKAPLLFATDRFRLEEKMVNHKIVFDVYEDGKIRLENLECELKGVYQIKNLPGVLSTVDELRKGGFEISEDVVRRGIGSVATLTHLKGRWQKLNDQPLVICDTGHNEEGIREVVKQIRSIPYNRLHMVIGVVGDKDFSRVLMLLPRDAKYYFCQAKIPRALPALELQDRAKELGLDGSVYPDVNDAIAKAKQEASADDFIFVGGSTFVVAEIANL